MKLKKQIIIVNQDSGYLMIDLAHVFCDAGYDVTLITGRLVKRNQELSEDIKLKTIIKYNRTSTLNRLLTWGVGWVQILFYLWFSINKQVSLLIVSNPPFAPLLPQIVSNPFSLLVYDVYPDALTETGIFTENSFIVKMWKKWNRKVYPKAKKIYTLTEGMKSIISNYVIADRIEIVPVWTNNQYLKPVNHDQNPFRKHHGLEGKFVVLYSGNLGHSHDVEVIIELAKRIKSKDISFVIIGDGEKKKILEKKVMKSKLKNVLLLPFQPANLLSDSLSAADLAVVTLGKGASKLSVPSKTYNLLSVGAALMCIADPSSELAALIRKYNNGQHFMASEIDRMVHFIEEISTNQARLNEYKQNSLKASMDFGIDNAKKFL